MSDVTFTILGTTGSGKTCYLTGMYYEMCSGMEGYTLIAEDDDVDISLRKKWENLCNEKQGSNRFPLGTDKNEEYKFDLEYGYKKIKSFNWLDYPGGAIETKGTNNIEEYQQLENTIMKSSCLFICVDGSLLVGENLNEVVKNINNQCSGKINSFISKYNKKNEYIPPIGIVITKYDICLGIDKDVLVNDIIRKAFSPLFVEESKHPIEVSVIPVSIGRNISDNNYSGNLEPINIHLPLFFGIWYALNKDIGNMKKELTSIEKMEENIQYDLNKENSKFFMFKNKNNILKCKREIGHIKEKKQLLNNKINDHDEYVKKLYNQIHTLGIYINGKLREFNDVKF